YMLDLRTLAFAMSPAPAHVKAAALTSKSKKGKRANQPPPPKPRELSVATLTAAVNSFKLKWNPSAPFKLPADYICYADSIIPSQNATPIAYPPKGIAAKAPKSAAQRAA